jgi:hypothetical protein
MTLGRKMHPKPYHKFSLIPETETQGWIFGAITEFESPGGRPFLEGDGFVQAPDGTRAGLDWVTEGEEIEIISPPDSRTWGVYQVKFPKPVSSLADLIECFRSALPIIKRKYEETKVA